MSRTGFFAAMRCTARTWSEGVIGLSTLTVIATEWPFPASAGTSSLTRPGRTGIPLVKDQTRGSVVLTCGLNKIPALHFKVERNATASSISWSVSSGLPRYCGATARRPSTRP